MRAVNLAASFQAKSSNRKLSPVERIPYAHKDFTFRPTPVGPFCSSTFASIAHTCSDSCVFKRGPNGELGGCYVDSDSFMRRAMMALDAAARAGRDPISDEVELLDAIYLRGVPQDGARGGRDLRLHVGGDVPDVLGALQLAGAAGRWRLRGGGLVWTFTHSWPTILRRDFGVISVLASVENVIDIRAVRSRGYAPALVVDKFPAGKRVFRHGGIDFIPCPAETLKKTCVECRLCLNADGLYQRRQGIAFEVHGQGAAVAKAALVPLGIRRRAA